MNAVKTAPGAPYIVAPDGRQLLITQAAPRVHRGSLGSNGMFDITAHRDEDIMISAIVPVLTDTVPTGEIQVMDLMRNRVIYSASVAAMHRHAETVFNGKLREAAETSALALTQLSERILAFTAQMPETIAIAEHSLIAVMRQATAAWHELVGVAFSPTVQLPLHTGVCGCFQFRYVGADDFALFPVDVYLIKFATTR